MLSPFEIKWKDAAESDEDSMGGAVGASPRRAIDGWGELKYKWATMHTARATIMGVTKLISFLVSFLFFLFHTK
ncbi:MAG: hypothetical protein Hyperionvirus19_44 [Hyperionvirus sp.]|uniref:Uncharacterized protein n=1 Tax=Hyperionvirus sp. TaxID=2487770 RepID=A0A3G5AAG2_9VIRU|nr:MAG: hypothetical protein Hyperionvirus19_44 [Hyperionvirus sp.]